MILYNPSAGINLLDFGILIPIRYDKHEMVFQGLRAALADFPVDQWRRSPACFDVITREDLLRVHGEEYVGRLYSKAIDAEVLRTYELVDAQGRFNRYDPSRAVRPLADLLTRALAMTGGTYECGREALAGGFAYFLGGGMHHAMRDFGEGFCLVNDVVVSLRRLQAEGRVKNLWVIDVDAHKGDGTAALTRGDSTIRTLSAHMDTGWPLDSPEYGPDGAYNPSWTPSDIDIGIPEGGEADYVPRLREGLRELERLCPRPDMALVVDGSDPYEKDELASTKPLSLTKEALLERDLLIYAFLAERKIPGAWISAGGYGAHSWEVYVNFLSQIMRERLTHGTSRG